MGTVWLQAAASGIALGAIYAGIGAGLSLILATGRLINLSHGQFVLAGGYVLYLFSDGAGWPWPAAIALAILVGALLGGALPPLVRRMPDREVNGLALTLGVAFLLQNLLLLAATATYRMIPGGYWLQSVALGPVVLTRVTLVAAGAAALLLAGLDIWLRFTWTGLGLAAVAQSSPAAASLGISPRRMERVAFLAGGAIASTAGALVLLTRFLSPAEGPAWTLVALAVAFLAGRPRAGVLLAAGVGLGLVESFATVLAGGAWREAVASSAILLWLLLRGKALLADA